MGSLVVVRRERLESFLAGCVPQDNLHFVWPVLQHYLSRAEFDGDC